MLHFRFTAILTLIAFSTLVGSCGGGEKRNGNLSTLPNSNQATTTSAKTNAEELGLLVNIPYETEDIEWKEDDANKKLIAVFRLTPADAAKVVAEAEKVRPPQPVNLASESWFPAELIAQSAMSGDDSLNGKSYAANSFLQEPYKSGSITRIDNTDYFVLEVSAK